MALVEALHEQHQAECALQAVRDARGKKLDEPLKPSRPPREHSKGEHRHQDERYDSPQEEHHLPAHAVREHDDGDEPRGQSSPRRRRDGQVEPREDERPRDGHEHGGRVDAHERRPRLP